MASEAVDALGVGGEELVPRLVVEAGGDLAVGGEQLVEGAVEAVDGEVAGEEAAVDAEDLDGLLDPGPEHAGVHRAQGHGEPRQLAAHPLAQRLQGDETVTPERP